MRAGVKRAQGRATVMDHGRLVVCYGCAQNQPNPASWQLHNHPHHLLPRLLGTLGFECGSTNKRVCRGGGEVARARMSPLPPHIAPDRKGAWQITNCRLGVRCSAGNSRCRTMRRSHSDAVSGDKMLSTYLNPEGERGGASGHHGTRILGVAVERGHGARVTGDFAQSSRT
jgi:hypothetical protein